MEKRTVATRKAAPAYQYGISFEVKRPEILTIPFTRHPNMKQASPEFHRLKDTLVTRFSCFAARRIILGIRPPKSGIRNILCMYTEYSPKLKEV
jgi:hypothetical protein